MSVKHIAINADYLGQGGITDPRVKLYGKGGRDVSRYLVGTPSIEGRVIHVEFDKLNPGVYTVEVSAKVGEKNEKIAVLITVTNNLNSYYG